MIPKISVIIPVYNVEKYLQDCIDSLLAQTMEDIEYIFIDDASTDSSLKILEKNYQRYPEKIQVIQSPENRRQGAARNLGIRAAKGEYIGFVDSDDFVLETMYKSLYDEIKKRVQMLVLLNIFRCQTKLIYNLLHHIEIHGNVKFFQIGAKNFLISEQFY